MNLKKNRYARLLHILNIIQTRNVKAEDLVDECGISIRTVYRDIELLLASGIPIYFENGLKLQGSKLLPPVSLSQREKFLLKLVIDSSPLSKIDSHRSELSQLWGKIAGNLALTNNGVSLTDRDIKISPCQSTGDMIDSELFKQIELAISEKKICRIRYRDIKGKTSNRKIHPYSMLFRVHAFYLLAYCMKRNSFRLFRLERIISFEASRDIYKPDEQFSIDKYFKYSWGVGGGQPFDIKIRFSNNVSEMIRSGRRHHTEKIKELKNGDLEYYIQACGLDEISRWIIGFGSDATVIFPKRLAELVCQLADGAAKQYK